MHSTIDLTCFEFSEYLLHWAQPPLLGGPTIVEFTKNAGISARITILRHAQSPAPGW